MSISKPTQKDSNLAISIPREHNLKCATPEKLMPPDAVDNGEEKKLDNKTNQA